MRSFLLLMAILLAGPALLADEPKAPLGRLPRNADELEVTLEVVEALEDGPVVCKVHLHNKTKEILTIHEPIGIENAFCRGQGEGWKTRSLILRMYFVFGISHSPPISWFDLAPDGVKTHSFPVHAGCLELPKGEIEVEFGWKIWPLMPAYNPSGFSVENWKKKQSSYLFEIRKRQLVKLLPATAENVAISLRRLEDAIFCRMQEPPESYQSEALKNYREAQERIDSAKDCRHPEFVPALWLIFENHLFTYDQVSNTRNHFLTAIYDSMPEPGQGFEVLFERLNSSNPHMVEHILAYWRREKEDCEDAYRQSDWKRLIVEDGYEATIEERLDLGCQQGHQFQCWHGSKRHEETFLTASQFARLRTIRDPWVRLMLFATFPDEFPVDWVGRLLHDLETLAISNDRMKGLMSRLDDRRFRVRDLASRELMDIWYLLPAKEWEDWKRKASPEVAQQLAKVQAKIDSYINLDPRILPQDRSGLPPQVETAMSYFMGDMDRFIGQNDSVHRIIRRAFLKAAGPSIALDLHCRKWPRSQAIRDLYLRGLDPLYTELGILKKPAKPACIYGNAD